MPVSLYGHEDAPASDFSPLGSGEDCAALLWELSAGFPESFAKLAGLPVWEPGAKGERSVMRPDLRERLDACIVAKGTGKLAQWAAQQTPEQRAENEAYVRAVVDSYVSQRLADGADPDEIATVVHAIDANPSSVYGAAQSKLDAWGIKTPTMGLILAGAAIAAVIFFTRKK